MTDAEKMREAAARIVDPTPNARNGLWAENLRRKAEAIRALPIPDAPAADCQQASVRRENSELKDQIASLSIAAGMADMLEAGLQEEIAMLRAERLSPGLLDEVKAALLIAKTALADSRWEGSEIHRYVEDTLARLKREVG